MLSLTRVQGQVDEVIDVMQDNIGKVMDRGQRLEDLQDKSGMWIIAIIKWFRSSSVIQGRCSLT